MIIQRLSKGIKNQDWFVVMVEIMIVVVGIFIGLQVDDWNEGRENNARELAYLQALAVDFEINKQNFDIQIDEVSVMLSNMQVLIEQSDMIKPSLSVIKLNVLMHSLQKMTDYADTDRTYVNMISSGELHLLSDEPLKNFLANYYSKLKIVQLVQNTHEMELVETFQPYIIKNLEYRDIAIQRVDDFELKPSKSPDSLLAVLGTREFRNIIVQKWVILTDLQDQYRSRKSENQVALDRMKQLLAEKGLS